MRGASILRPDHGLGASKRKAGDLANEEIAHDFTWHYNVRQKSMHKSK